MKISNKGQWATFEYDFEKEELTITQPRGERKTAICHEWADKWDEKERFNIIKFEDL